MATVLIDTTSCNSDYRVILPQTYSLGTYLTIKDSGSNSSFFASNSIIIVTSPGYSFYDGSDRQFIRRSGDSLSFTAMTYTWRLVNTYAYTPTESANLSNVSTTHLISLGSLSLSNLIVQNSLTVSGGIDLQNQITIGGYPPIQVSQIISTVNGLGTFGLVSTPTFITSNVQSTIEGLGTYGYISIPQITSTVGGIGKTYISSRALFSSFARLGTYYISTPSLQSTIAGLGTLGYISTDRLYSTVGGLGRNYISTSQLTSTISNVLAQTSSNFQSTFTKLGSTYVSTLSLLSTVQGLSNTYVFSNIFTSTQTGVASTYSNAIVSTVAGLASLGYISSQSLISTISNVIYSNESNISQQISSLGSTYVSSLSLQSTVNGLGISKFLSVSQLTSTVVSLTNINQLNLTSTVNGLGHIYISTASLNSTTSRFISVNSNITSTFAGLGSIYISSLTLSSTINGLGTFGYMSISALTSTTSNILTPGIIATASTIAGLGQIYISVPQLTSTVTGFSTANRSNLISTVNTLGSNGYISTATLNAAFAGLTIGGFISPPQFTSTVTGINDTLFSNASSTIANLGQFKYISTLHLVSTVIGFSNTNTSNFISTVTTLGSNYVSSLSLQSTVTSLSSIYLNLPELISTTSTLVSVSYGIPSTLAGLGQIYLSTPHLTSTVVGVSNVNRSNYISTVNTLSSNYISSLSLQSTVAGLGTSYISLSQLTSTTTGIPQITSIPPSMISNVNTLSYIRSPNLLTTSILFLSSNGQQTIQAVTCTETSIIHGGYDTTQARTIYYTNNFSGTNRQILLSRPVQSVFGSQLGYCLSYDGSLAYAIINSNTSNQIVSINPSTLAVTPILSNVNAYSFCIDTTYTNLYVCDYNNSTLLRLQLSTKTVTTVTTFFTFQRPKGIAVDSVNGYVLCSDNVVYRVPLTGGTPVNLIGPTLSQPKCICIDSTSPYLYIPTSDIFLNYTYQINTITGVKTPVAPASAMQYNSAEQIFYNVYDDSMYIAAGNAVIRLYYDGYISSLTLQSKVSGLGSSYISSQSLLSTVRGLGTFGYLSIPYLISTTSNLSQGFMPPFTSTTEGLGTVGYISTLSNIIPDMYSVTTLPMSATINYTISPNNNYVIAVSSNYIFYTFLGTYIGPTGTTFPNSLVIFKYSLDAGTDSPVLLKGYSSVTIPPLGLTCDSTNVYIAIERNRIDSININTGGTTTIANTFNTEGFADGTSPANVYFKNINGICMDSGFSNIYVCDSGNFRIRKIQLNPFSVSTVFITSTVSAIASPIAITVDSLQEYLYVTGGSTGGIYMISLRGDNYFKQILNVPPVSGFVSYYGISLDSTGTLLYISNSYIGNSGIYEINIATGIFSLLAGSSTGSLGSTDGDGSLARFYTPYAIVFNRYDSCIYVADSGNNAIRKISTKTYASTLLGLQNSAIVNRYNSYNPAFTGAPVGQFLTYSGGITTTPNLTTTGSVVNITGNLYASNITAATFTASSGRSTGVPSWGFYIGSGTYVTTISDNRLKEDIHPIENALEKVSSLQAVRYKMYRDPSHNWIGYIAQDIEPILPEVVRTDDSPEEWKSIQYTNLPGLIIEAVKELNEKYTRIKFLLSNSI